jgi:hypothetical protein
MRIHRAALIFLVPIATTLTVVTLTGGFVKATPERTTAWKSSATLDTLPKIPFSTMTSTTTTTATSVPSSPPVSQPTSPVAITTSAPATYEGDAYAEWTKVADCEEGGWIGYAGPAYPDSLGINATNWYGNGGGSDVSPAAQIAVAQRIEGTDHVPDQNGCAAW